MLPQDNRHLLEAEFRLDYNRKTIPIYRWGLAVVAVIFALFYILDFHVIPDALFVSGLIRLAVVPALLGIFIAFSYWKGYERHHQPALAAVSFLYFLLLLAIIMFSRSPDRYLYFGGLALMMLTFAFILRPRMWWYAAGSLALIVAALGVLLTSDFPPNGKLTMALYLVATIIGGSIGCQLMERFYWHDFLLHREVEKARDRAEQATLLKDKYISLVSHDLKGPLSAIRGFMHLSQNPSASPGELREYAKHSYNSANGLLNTIESLLNIDRFQSGEIRPDPRPFDASALAAETLMKLQYLADAKGIATRIEIPTGATLTGDRVLIGHVLQNLIGNAIKFTPGGGAVSLFLPDNRTIAVRDTGGGIPPQILPHLFSHELKTTGIGTAGEKGTGLGLPLCHDIIKAHNGLLRVESGAAGTTMYVELPIA